MSDITRHIRLGAFVITGSILLIIALYFIGNKQNLFGSTFTVLTRFSDVSGLMKGNNVRFAGIDVGTVEDIEIINDSLVEVTMIIEKSVQSHIKKNAIASVGTDGLMGNKLINISSAGIPAESVEEGDRLISRPVEMEQMMRTLNVTNENIKVITENLKDITEKFSNENGLWSVLMDTAVARNVKSSIVNIRIMSRQGLSVTGNLESLTAHIRSGKGSLGALIMDTVLSSKIKQTVLKINMVSDTAAILTGNISDIARNLKEGKGSLGVLLHDTTMVHDLNKTVLSLRNGADNFNLNMEALRLSWPFKKYFKKQEKNHRGKTK